ncbi:MAG: DUF4878 domain-containing protein [Alistipes sp.]|nr:DUF4878 domain-containing protein [Alistipes sp.]
MKKFFMMAAAVAALFATSCSSPTASDAAVNVYSLIGDGKYEAAVEEFNLGTADAETEKQSKEMLTSLMKEKVGPQIEQKGGIANCEAVNEVLSEDGKTAKVTVKITYGNGETDENEVDMVLTDNGWKAAVEK